MSVPLRLPVLPPRDRAALLLDIDGTLLDIAPRPEAVVVPPDLLDTLRLLRRIQGGALAVISGRPIEQIDELLGDAPCAVAGEHGSALRQAPDGPVQRADLPSPPPVWVEAARRLAQPHPGVLVETKRNGFVLHYRLAPDAGALLRDGLEQILAGTKDFVLMPARKAWEIKPRGADKGTAVAELMRHPPFEGRLPVFVGDDVTDEDGIAVAIAHGGAGLRVAENFGNPAGVRAWLARLAREEGVWAAS